jgi:trigger factor
MLKVEVRREPGSRAVLEVEVPGERVNQAVDRALVRLGRRTTIPGFRRGRAPRVILERYLGQEAVYDAALEELIPEVLREAVEQAGIRPISRPQVNVEGMATGQPLRLRATVEVLPEVRLPDYRSLRIPRPAVTVGEEEVDRAIEAIRARFAQLVPKEGPAEPGDFVLIRVEEAPAGEERYAPGKELLVELGAQGTPPELGEALRGAASGQTVEVAGNEGGRLRVSVVGVRRRELPPLDDAFAQEAGGQPTLEALRADVRARLEAQAERRAAEAHEEEVVRTVVEQAEVDLPESLVHAEVHDLLEDLARRVSQQGLTVERYLALGGKTMEQLHEEYRSVAQRRVRTRLVLDRIAEAEGLEPTEEELSEAVENLAQDLGQEVDRVRTWLREGDRMEALRVRLRRRKAIAFLVAVASGAHGSTPQEASA